MLATLRRFLSSQSESRPGATPDKNRSVQLATAALLLEIRRADDVKSHVEHQAISSILIKELKLKDSEVAALLSEADEQVEEAVSLYEFTRELNQALSAEQKVQVIEYLWRVAFSDQYLDKYEEHLIRKISDLLYVPHRMFIRAKHRAQDAEISAEAGE